MEQNPVGSINFDANALYLEEESENELDDKQQDNEVSDIFNIKFFFCKNRSLYCFYIFETFS